MLVTELLRKIGFAYNAPELLQFDNTIVQANVRFFCCRGDGGLVCVCVCLRGWGANVFSSYSFLPSFVPSFLLLPFLFLPQSMTQWQEHLNVCLEVIGQVAELFPNDVMSIVFPTLQQHTENFGCIHKFLVLTPEQVIFFV